MVAIFVAVILLPVLMPTRDVMSGSSLAAADEVTWSGCPPTYVVVAKNKNETNLERCECTTFGEIHCYNLVAVPAFNHPPSVTWRGVYMSRQLITELPSGVFGNLRASKLVLNFNRLGDRVEAGALAGQETSLAELQLAGCGITSFPGGLLVGMEHLQRLHLWGNRLRDFPVRFFRAAAQLQELMLWNNELENLDPDTLAGLWSLRRLDLDRNSIVELHKDAFRNLIELRSLRIAYNRVQALHSETFVYMNNLRVLSLSGNVIQFLYDRVFDGLSNLITLSLANNRINYLPENVFSPLSNLTDLMLQQNRLEFWLRTFCGLIFLLPGRTFVGLKSLRRLSVAGNRLTSLPEAALRHSPSLSYVDLAENNFRSIERCAFPVSTSGLRTLSIVGNPVVCNCSLAWLAVAKDHTSRVVWGTCRQPRHLAESFAQNGADIMIDSVVKLANTCTDFDVPDCRFD